MAVTDRPDLVLVTSRSFGSGDSDPEALLTAAGLRVVRGDPGHDLTALRPVLAETVAWLAGTGPIRAEQLDAAPDLAIVARYGTGTDTVDLAAARARGIVVTNTPGANADAVAEHTLALLLGCLRHLVAADRAVRAGQHPRFVGRELGSLTIGLIGLGHVGRAVARRLVALGVTVVGHDPGVGAEAVASEGVAWLPLDDLLERCDAVSVHSPGGGVPVLDRGALSRLRPGAVVVNAARHDVVDEAALAELLRAGRLAAAAVDTISGADSPLLEAPNTLLTPHIAGQTAEAVDRMGLMAAEDILAVAVHGTPPRHPV